MDRLSPLFNRFTLSARVFHAGLHCGVEEFANDRGVGLLHVLRRGHLRVCRPGLPCLDLEEPALLFCRHPVAHRFEVDQRDGADLVCGVIDFGSGPGNPVLRGLPDLLVVPTAALPAAEGALALLFGEAFSQRAGREAALDRLVEYVVVLLLRHAVEHRLVAGGVLAALSDERLAGAVLAMHAQPGHPWTLDELAARAGMSRARFAVNFRTAVGVPPLDYLTDWRISVGQSLLRRGQALKAVAPAVGYSSPIAFTRVFARRVGATPMAWLAAQDAPGGA
ncbi:MAG: helix-turn-helix transcriptional regulator [Piscinibacter sp.]|nr:helix-turn-helix transcriptional regulator [Piscinibacter sp.]